MSDGTADKAPILSSLGGLAEHAIANGWPAEEVAAALSAAAGPTIKNVVVPAPSVKVTSSSSAVLRAFKTTTKAKS
jgi:hypothetical protein